MAFTLPTHKVQDGHYAQKSEEGEQKVGMPLNLFLVGLAEMWQCEAFRSAVPKRGRPKRGRTQKHANKRKRAQMSAMQKGAKERKTALLRKNCKQPGLKQPGLGTPHPRIAGKGAQEAPQNSWEIRKALPKKESQLAPPHSRPLEERYFSETPGRKAWEDLLETFWGFQVQGASRLLVFGGSDRNAWLPIEASLVSC